MIGKGHALGGQMALHGFLGLQGAVSKILIIGENEDDVGSGLGGIYACTKTQDD
jgi:hypothetical protein